MAFRTDRFSYYIWASGGSSGADLTFADDDTAILNYRSSWMGASKYEYRLSFQVKRFSARYGLLALTEAERIDTAQRWSAAQINEAVCGFHDDDERMLYWGVSYEFLQLDGGEDHVPNDPHLLDFFNAGWNPRMEMILFGRVSASAIADSGVDPELGAVLTNIDRLKLGRTEDG